MNQTFMQESVSLLSYFPMKALTTTLFLASFIFTGVIIVGNIKNYGEFIFLLPFEGKSLALPFLGFTCLGILIGVLFVLSLKYTFRKTEETLIEKN